MNERERRREPVSELPDRQLIEERREEGWRLVALEWERAREGEAGEGKRREVPYGLRVADDCRHLVEDADEMEALMLMLELIAEDRPMSKVAEELNSRGYRVRDGSPWTQSAVFNLLPRVIEVAPRIFASDDWKSRRRSA